MNIDYQEKLDEFEPLTEDEQKLFLILCLTEIEGCNEILEDKSIKGKKRTDASMAKSVFEMIVKLFTKSKKIQEMGAPQLKEILLEEYAQSKYDEFINSKKGRGC